MTRLWSALCAGSMLIAVSGCTPPVKPIVINRDKLVQSGTLSLDAIELAVSAYQKNHTLSGRALDDLQIADLTARNLIAKLRNDVAVNLPVDAQLAANGLQAIAAAIPPGVIPPAAQAGLLAFVALAELVAQTAPQAVTAPSVVTPAPAATPTAVPAVTTPAAPLAAPAAAPAVTSSDHSTVDNSTQAPRPAWLAPSAR